MKNITSRWFLIFIERKELMKRFDDESLKRLLILVLFQMLLYFDLFQTFTDVNHILVRPVCKVSLSYYEKFKFIFYNALYSYQFDSIKGAKFILYFIYKVFATTFIQSNFIFHLKMDAIAENPQALNYEKQSNSQKDHQLFDQLSMSEENPFENLELSSQLKNNDSELNNQNQKDSSDIVDFREMMKRTKKQKKKLKKKLKKQAIKQKQEGLKENLNLNIASSAKKNNKKMVLDSEDEQQQPFKQPVQTKKSDKKKKKQFSDEQNLSQHHQDDSAQYSSQENLSNSESERNDQQLEDNDQNKQFKKKLGGKSRRQRILQKEGFDLKQLGNDGDVNYELNQSIDESDDSFLGGEKKKKGSKRVKKDKSDKKQKKPKMTNEQFLNKLKQLGCEDQKQQNQSQKNNYDTGFDDLKKLRPKKQSKNTIKVQNKLFGNLEMEIQQKLNDHQNNSLPQQQIVQEKLQLEIKPKTFSSRAASFLNKVETLKKHRGLEADVDHAEFEKITKEKTKKSISQLVTKIQNEVEDDEEIDIDVKAPTIAKGKKADLINNTMFILKSLSQKQSNSDQISQDVNNSNNQESKIFSKIPEQKANEKNPTNQVSQTFAKKKPVSRFQFFKQIKQSINVRRSKYVSTQELKNSIKSSKLEELEEIRKKIEEKRRKQAMYELGEVDDDDAENVINELQEELIRREGISKDDLNKLLREEEELQQLDQYQDEDIKKKGEKKNLTTQEKIQQKVSPRDETKNEKKNENISYKKQELTEQNNLTKLKIDHKLQSAEESAVHQAHQKHQDDQIQEFESLQERQISQGMDIQDEDNQQNDEDEGSEQELENGQDQIQDQIQNQIQSEDNTENEQLQQKQDENQKLKIRRELEDEGIIMPGAHLKKNHFLPQQIDLNRFILPNEQGQNQSAFIDTNPQPSLNVQAFIRQQQTLQFKEFRKLRKIAVVIQQKRKKRQEQLDRAKQFFQQEAELGSDNEENDDNIKAIRKDDDQEADGDDLDQQLEELIDNAVDINEADEQEAFRKYMQDVKQKDRQELQKILRGEFRRPNHDLPEMQEMQEDDRQRMERMQKMVEWMRKREDDQKDLYAKQQSDEDDQMNYYYDKNGKKKKIELKRHKDQDQESQELSEEDDEEVQKKLQYYLMDSISPAKKSVQTPFDNQLVMELPNISKKNSRPFVAPFATKLFYHSTEGDKNHHQKSEKKTISNILNFSGSILNFSKRERNQFGIPKTKKIASHMSEQLNKNKTQKPITSNGLSTKLSAIFGRVPNIKK